MSQISVGARTKGEITPRCRRTCACGGSKFDTLLSQRFNLLHPNLGRRLCWNITAPATQDLGVSIPSLSNRFDSQNTFPGFREASGSRDKSCDGTSVPKCTIIFREYVRAGISIWFVKSKDISDVCPSLDLGLYVTEEGGRIARTPKHGDKLEFREVCEGGRRLGSIVVIPSEVGRWGVPISIVLGIFFARYINKASFR